MHGLATRLLCLFLSGFLLMVSPPAYAQNTEIPTSPSSGSSSVSRTISRGPLSDYVPCLFNEDEQWDMRAQVAVQRPLDYRYAQQLLDYTTIELSQILGQYSQQNSAFVADVYKEYNGRLSAKLSLE